MQRVTGIGGVFFKAKDPKALGAWYQKHLGVPIEAWGGAVFQWNNPGAPAGTGSTVWCPFSAETKYFQPSTAPFMVNFRVQDVRALVAILKEEGCAVDDRVETTEQGTFAWVMDPEGNRVELWQPAEGM